MTARPLKELRLPELRRHFDENVDSPEQLVLLATELGCRHREKAKRLREEVDARLQVFAADGQVEASSQNSPPNTPKSVDDLRASQVNSNQELLNSLERKFPLLGELRFFNSDSRAPERLPPVIALMAAMTNPDLPGDACVILPSRERVAAFDLSGGGRARSPTTSGSLSFARSFAVRNLLICRVDCGDGPERGLHRSTLRFEGGGSSC